MLMIYGSSLHKTECLQWKISDIIMNTMAFCYTNYLMSITGLLYITVVYTEHWFMHLLLPAGVECQIPQKRNTTHSNAPQIMSRSGLVDYFIAVQSSGCFIHQHNIWLLVEYCVHASIILQCKVVSNIISSSAMSQLKLHSYHLGHIFY